MNKKLKETQNLNTNLGKYIIDIFCTEAIDLTPKALTVTKMKFLFTLLLLVETFKWWE